MSCFIHLSRPALVDLAAALETKRLSFPIHASYLGSYVPDRLKQAVATELNHLDRSGMGASHIAHMLRLIWEERGVAQTNRDRVDLVWTGQEVMGSSSRDTRIVVQELFSSAKSSVLISTYAIDRARKAQELFQGLAARMDANPSLQVRMFLNVKRPFGNQQLSSAILKQFAEDFKHQIWCGKRLPEVFHDPRSLSPQTHSQACLHAKCVVVDEERLLITSANFTEAAHERNIEAGILIVDPLAASNMRSQFETLVARNILCRVPGL